MIYWFFSRPIGVKNKEHKQIIDFVFQHFKIKLRNISYYKKALTHPSTFGHKKDNTFERLEFLGDGVLDLIMRAYLIDAFKKQDEGILTKMKSGIVKRATLNRIARIIDLPEIVKVETSGISPKNSIYGNALEALMGAIYLDQGYNKSKKSLTAFMLKHLDFSKMDFDQNYKGNVIEWAQKNRKKWKFSTSISEKSDAYFQSRLLINDQEVSKSAGSSKKEAEQNAAKKYLELLVEEGKS